MNGANEIYLSVVIPAYNEAHRIAATLKTVSDYLKTKEFKSEIIVVDDGSVDGTRETAEASITSNILCLTIGDKINRGKGYALKQGFAAASGKFILFTDADLSVAPEEFDKFLPYLEKGYDMVIGSRKLPESVVAIHQPKWREFCGRMFYRIVFAFLINGKIDLNCGFKAYSCDAAKKLYSKLTIYRWGFDTEIIYLAQKYGYKIKEAAVTWSDRRGSKVRLFSAVFTTLFEMLKIKINDLTGKYN